jgi:hypothetical protein
MPCFHLACVGWLARLQWSCCSDALTGVFGLVHAEDCGVATRLTATLACFALWTEVYWESGHREHAKHAALRFVREAEVPGCGA